MRNKEVRKEGGSQKRKNAGRVTLIISGGKKGTAVIIFDEGSYMIA